MTTRRTRLVIAGVLLGATALAGARGMHRPPGSRDGTTTVTAPAAGRVTFAGTLDRTSVLRGGDVDAALAAGGELGLSEAAIKSDLEAAGKESDAMSRLIVKVGGVEVVWSKFAAAEKRVEQLDSDLTRAKKERDAAGVELKNSIKVADAAREALVAIRASAPRAFG